MRFGIIGGSGFYEVSEETAKTRQVATAYGDVDVDIVQTGTEEVAFLARHGKGHSIAPHKINYRANIAALKGLGVENILASAAVGSLNPTMGPGEFALPTQFIDFTCGRESSFAGENEVIHLDMTTPYCPALQESLMSCALASDAVIHPDAVYVCTQGPRFETPAEIEMFRRAGGDLVGMTGVPEAVLAREAGICYATLALITNRAAGLGEGPIAHAEVAKLAAGRIPAMREIFISVVSSFKGSGCACCRTKA